MKLSIEAPDNEIAEPGEVHLHLRFRPVNFIGIAIVLIIHALLLYFLLNIQVEKKKKQGDDAGSHTPMVLILDKAVVAKMAAPAPKKSTPKPPLIPHTKKSITPPTPVAPVQSAQTTVNTPTPIVEAPPQQDMMSMLNAARERRRAQQEAANQEDQANNQSNRGMSAQEVVEANVRHSMQQAAGRDGTNGVFQIISMSTRVGSFSFRGWKPTSGSTWKQTIEVDAGLGGDLQLAMIRRMIELIRSHYPGDFSWESRRLGRVVTLSARPQDSEQLEAFLRKEFFG
ncbi:hypothetical protein ACO0KY_18710 [Undibacterium sp. Dicai25W]|uniref:hypothetical protein n=1 Tax=Undibacterium sp. Dicai25W TaxID=3413034 RepID=UPI003BEF505F